MTDTRLPERFLLDRRLARLTPVEFRSFITGFMWTVANRTNGYIEPEDLALIPLFANTSIAKFEAQGLWVEAGRGWYIVDWKATQTAKDDLEVLERARQADAERKRRARAEGRIAKAGESTPVRPDVQGTVQGTRPPDDTGQRQTTDDRDRRQSKDYEGGPVAWSSEGAA